MVNLKKAALAVLALGAVVSSNTALAAMYEPPPSMAAQSEAPKHGPYVGIGLGGIGFENQLDGQMSGTFNDGTRSAAGSVNLDNADGGNYGLNSYLLVGYGWTFPNKVFLGGEIFGNLTNVPVSVNANVNGQGATDGIVTADAAGNASGTINQTLQNVYGIRLLPGYQVTPSSVVYGIIGYARAHTNTSAGGAGGGDLAIGDLVDETGSVGGSVSSSYNYNGLQLGLGSMISVTDHIALRADLIWTGYESQTLTSGSYTDPNGLGAVQGSLSSQPTTLEADVGVIYMFD